MGRGSYMQAGKGAGVTATWGGMQNPGKPRVLDLDLALQVIVQVCSSREENIL